MLLVRGARQLLTLRDELAIIPDGSVLIRGSVVEQTGATRRVVNLNDARDAVEIDASGCVVLPGFVDPDVELFSETYTPNSVTRLATRLLLTGTTAFRCPHPPRKAATFWTSFLNTFPDAAAGAPLQPGIRILTPIPSFTARCDPPADLAGTVALASGFRHGRQPAFSMQTAISLACLHLGLTIEQAIAAATINAAHSIGLGDRLGSLEPGKQADLLILDIADYRKIPYHLGENLVRVIIKRGRKVFERGEKICPP